MAFNKQQFVDVSRWMTIPLAKFSGEFRTADKNNSGSIDTAEDFAALYDLIIGNSQAQATFDSVLNVIQQARVDDSQALEGRELSQVPQLQAVWNGLGRIVRMTGTSAGTRAIQEALNEISEKLSDFPKCHVGEADGKFGQQTENAVKSFQAVHHGIELTGTVDSQTLQKMNEVLLRARTIKVNEVHPIDPGTLRIISYNDRFGQDCVLTFDDGPNADTVQVLDALQAANIKGATFFVQGINVRSHPQILRRIVEDGHVLGNHTYDHPDLRKLSIHDADKQLQMCQSAVNDALGREYVLRQMRPPYGAINDQVRSLLHSHNFEVMLWQVDSNDWRPENRRNPQNIVENVFGGQAPVSGGRGGLILFHDIHPSTGSILPEILRRLKEKGMRLTTAQALIDRKYAG
jgi:peptidoglycan/xylan/chitin deacetylase (PgdA/CDA1 family)